MNHSDVTKMLKEIALPFAYDHFVEGKSPKPPFVVFLYPKADNFAADGVAYHKINVLNIELYTNKKDPVLETNVETVLKEHGLFYAKSEVWIDSEKLYEVLYEMEV